MKEVEEWQLGYLAGMLDGEGCVSIYKHNPNSYGLTAEIANTRLDILEFLQSSFHGIVYTRLGSTIKGKDLHRLLWRGREAQVLLCSVFPKLIGKKEHAALAISFPIRRTSSELLTEDEVALREGIYLKMKELNKKGKSVENVNE